MEEFRGFEPAAELGRHRGDRWLEDINEPASRRISLRDRAAVVVSSSVRNGDVPEKPACLVLLDLEPGQAWSVRTCAPVDDAWLERRWYSPPWALTSTSSTSKPSPLSRCNRSSMRYRWSGKGDLSDELRPEPVVPPAQFLRRSAGPCE